MLKGFRITNESDVELVWTKDGIKSPFVIKALLDKENIDLEHYIISGFASVEEVDKQGDLITIEAFEKAVKELEADGEKLPLMLGHSSAKIGNVTDMVFLKDVTPRKFWIKAQLQKNSTLVKEKVWPKIADGTLKAFSIGGYARQPGVMYCEAQGRCFNKIDNIELFEVSLVEEPANELSLVMQVKNHLPRFVRKDYNDNTEEKGCHGESKTLKVKKPKEEKGQMIGKPFAGYADFDECVAANSDKEDPEAYCAEVLRQVDPTCGKGESNMEALEKTDDKQAKQEKEPVREEPKGEPKQGINKEIPAPPPAPAQPAHAPVDDSTKLISALQAKVEALEAEIKLRREAEEKAKAEALRLVEQKEQPDRRGVVPNAIPTPSESKGLLEIAEELNRKKVPMHYGTVRR